MESEAAFTASTAVQTVKAETEAAAPTAPITPMAMLQMAVEQGADLDKLSRLMDLQERWEANEAKRAYNAAKAAFQAEAPTIDKTRTAHNSAYAGLAETLEQIRGLLSKNSLSHSWRTEQGEGGITVTCCVTHTMGHQECTSLTAAPDTSGSKNSIQAVGSTVTYLERYTLFSVLGLASKEQDDDGDAADREPITHEQLEQLRALVDETETDLPKFCRYLGISNLTALPAGKFNQATAALTAKKMQKDEGQK